MSSESWAIVLFILVALPLASRISYRLAYGHWKMDFRKKP
jgi:hypothetical protein